MVQLKQFAIRLAGALGTSSVTRGKCSWNITSFLFFFYFRVNLIKKMSLYGGQCQSLAMSRTTLVKKKKMANAYVHSRPTCVKIACVNNLLIAIVAYIYYRKAHDGSAFTPQVKGLHLDIFFGLARSA